MVGGVIGFLICIWFYLTADRLKLNPLQWIVGALIVYYGAKALWTFVILKPLMGFGYTHYNMIGGIVMEALGTLLGVAACWLFRSRIMLKQGQ
jgi:hypothetical protein